MDNSFLGDHNFESTRALLDPVLKCPPNDTLQQGIKLSNENVDVNLNFLNRKVQEADPGKNTYNFLRSNYLTSLDLVKYFIFNLSILGFY